MKNMKIILIWGIVQFIFLTSTTMLFINGHQNLAGNLYIVFTVQFVLFIGYVVYFVLKKK
ncbi:MAG: hypothetical protein BGO88_09125 [Flavobacterium sp. 38-13]|nr:MAG: hypothetical protein BGO88_09125 [Flavobacterium sp. 38-13]